MDPSNGQRPMEDRPEHEELRHLAPTLGELPKSDPFVTPDAFFAQFPHRVQALVTAPKRSAPAWWQRMAVALPVITLLGLGAWWSQRDDTPLPITTPIAVQATDLSDEDLEAMDLPALLASAADDGPSPWAEVDVALSDAEFLAYAEQEGLDITDLITTP